MEICCECDCAHPIDKPHRYRVPCPDGRRGCLVAHYSPTKPVDLTAARNAVVEAAVARVEALRRGVGVLDPTHQEAMAREAAAVDAYQEARDE